MGAPAWLKPAITGGIVGAIATMVVGFSQGGWMLGSSAERMAQQKSTLAVTEALIPVCIAQSNSDPSAADKLQQLDAITSSYERREFVMKTGWATVPSAESPNSELAEACAEVLKAQQT
jgi:hypothetical protein